MVSPTLRLPAPRHADDAEYVDTGASWAEAGYSPKNAASISPDCADPIKGARNPGVNVKASAAVLQDRREARTGWWCDYKVLIRMLRNCTREPK